VGPAGAGLISPVLLRWACASALQSQSTTRLPPLPSTGAAGAPGGYTHRVSPKLARPFAERTPACWLTPGAAAGLSCNRPREPSTLPPNIRQLRARPMTILHRVLEQEGLAVCWCGLRDDHCIRLSCAASPGHSLLDGPGAPRTISDAPLSPSPLPPIALLSPSGCCGAEKRSRVVLNRPVALAGLAVGHPACRRAEGPGSRLLRIKSAIPDQKPGNAQPSYPLLANELSPAAWACSVRYVAVPGLHGRRERFSAA